MPYKRYAKKKIYRRKKRSYKKKMMYRRRATADKGHLEKLVKSVPVSVENLGQFAATAVHWLGTGVSGANEAFFTGGNANLSTQFSQCATMYREYYISSLKLEYRPAHLDAGSGNGF